MKLPAFQFYPGDWMKDPNLRRCCHAARGVWMDMLCLMFESGERGVLATGSSPWTRKDIAAAVGGNEDVTLRCIDELVAKQVCALRADGALYSRRLVKDEAAREGNRRRQEDFRNGKNNTPVTPLSEDEDEEVPVFDPLGIFKGRIGGWFKRRPSTPWTDKEVRALKAIRTPDEEDVATLEAYYTAKIEKDDWRRRDIVTLLNNWPGEIDRARAFVASPAYRKSPARVKAAAAPPEWLQDARGVQAAMKVGEVLDKERGGALAARIRALQHGAWSWFSGDEQNRMKAIVKEYPA